MTPAERNAAAQMQMITAGMAMMASGIHALQAMAESNDAGNYPPEEVEAFRGSLNGLEKALAGTQRAKSAAHERLLRIAPDIVAQIGT